MIKRNVSRTFHNSMLELKQMLGLTYSPLLNSTLNEAYNLPNPISSESYKLGHFIIGLSNIKTIEDNEVIINSIEHQPYDANVYIPIPVFMTPTTEVLTSLEKSQYALLTTKTYNNIEYHVAYAKATGVSGSSEPSFITHSNVDGYSISSLDNKNLNYTKPLSTKESVNYPDKLEFIAHNTSIGLELTANEMTLIKSYVDIIYPERAGDNKYNIMEVGVLHSQHLTNTDVNPISNAQVAYFQNLKSKDIVESSMKVSISLGDFMPVHNKG